MKFKDQIYLQINRPNIRLKIALALGVTEQSVINAIKFKRDALTKKAALDVIKEETGLTDAELFERRKIITK